MAFHIPPTYAWKPEDVLDSLLAIGLPARIESGHLRIDAPVIRDSHPLLSFLQRFRLLRPIFGKGYPPYHEFRLYPNRFLNNLDIHWNVDSLVENDHIIPKIREVMRNQGYDEVGLNPTERDIVQRYGIPNNELDSTLARLEAMRAGGYPRREHAKWWAEWKMLQDKIERLCITAFLS